MSLVLRCDTCKAKTKPRPLLTVNCHDQVADFFSDGWGAAREGNSIRTVCPDCWDRYRK